MYDIFIMDMGGNDANVKLLAERFPHSRIVRYYDNHLDTIRRCVARARTPWVWVISSCCDYTNFDFEYRAVPWENYQIHCWASGNEKFGDTFLIPVDEFRCQQGIELLEWYKDINWHTDGVMRLPVPVITYTFDDLVDTVKAAQFDTPYILFKRDIDPEVSFSPTLWKNRSVYTFNKANSVSLVPREIMSYLETQIYDYPFIMRQKDRFIGDKNLDIIYISNGETNADEFYEHLTLSSGATVKRVQNINGRDNAFKVAAEMSKTDWFFKVPAKLKINPKFDWSWQPDYLQEPKHYIFYADNPVNGLCYGHMAMVAYNKRLVLETETKDLDFTLSQPHEVVPISSGVAHYNSDPLMTWRTAFREVIKLIDNVKKTNSVESQYRLDIWLSKANGLNAKWSLCGAKDAVDYYSSVNGDYTDLMQSFDWGWLKEYYNSKYSI